MPLPLVLGLAFGKSHGISPAGAYPLDSTWDIVMLSPCLLLPVLFIIASGFAAARDGGDCGGDSNACDDVVLEVGDELIIIMLPFSISSTPHACAEEIFIPKEGEGRL